MGCELPWFKFDVSAYLTGRIQSHDMLAQGVFVNICNHLWWRGGNLSLKEEEIADLLRMQPEELAPILANLVDKKIVRKRGKQYSVKFIATQHAALSAAHKRRVKAGGLGGRQKAANRVSNAKGPPSNATGEPTKALAPPSIALALPSIGQHCLADRDRDVDKDREKRGSARARASSKVGKVFRKPTGAEVEAYCAHIGLAETEASIFTDFYSSKGWRVGKAPMKDWKAALRNWKRRNDKDEKPAAKLIPGEF